MTESVFMTPQNRRLFEPGSLIYDHEGTPYVIERYDITRDEIVAHRQDDFHKHRIFCTNEVTLLPPPSKRARAVDSGLVRQRSSDDCVIACVAMALSLRYDHVFNVAVNEGLYSSGSGIRNEMRLLVALGIPSKDFHLTHRGALDPAFMRHIMWGRRALITVPSRNYPGGWHMIYYNGRDILDPTLDHYKYEKFEEVEPDSFTVFRESPR
jgi:hypothetical protein